MKSLRRDLFERRLWPLAVVILAAAVAVPFLLHGHGADAAIAAPPAASASSGSQSTATHHASASTKPRPTPTSKTRDPFAQVVQKKTSHKSSSSSKKSQSTATTSATSPTSSSASASTSGGGSSSSSGGGSSSSSSTSSATTTPVVTTPVTTSPTTSTGTGTGTTPAKTQSWDVYSVDVRAGAPKAAVSHHDIARLMPLPSERAPEALYMGVSDHGHSAVFALAAGVEVSNLGGDRSIGAYCHPTRADCALVVIPEGKSVGLTYKSASGAHRALVLRLARISSHVTHSAAAVKTARAHVSPVGLCDLKLGDPIGFFDPADDNMKIASTASCHKVKFASPFPGSLGAGSSEQQG
jgi:hypothetical protein